MSVHLHICELHHELLVCKLLSPLGSPPTEVSPSTYVIRARIQYCHHLVWASTLLQLSEAVSDTQLESLGV